jgi:hypothetical protein
LSSDRLRSAAATLERRWLTLVVPVHEVLDHSPWAEGGAVDHVLGNGQTEDLLKIHHSIRSAERALGTNS